MKNDDSTGERSFHESLPKKRMAAGALLFDAHGNLLIVNPTYKEGWDMPGGIVEDNESPAAACRREIREEIGLDLHPGRLLGVDYTSSGPDYLESLMFVFAGPELTKPNIDTIVIDDTEISEARLVKPAQALNLLRPRVARRVARILDPSSNNVYFDRTP